MNKDIFCKGYTWGFFSKRGDFQTEAAEKSMERLASNGLNWICIPVNALQESFASTRVFSDYERTQSDEDIAFAIKKAKSLGLKVCLKPMVDCLDHSWRARIDFPPENPECFTMQSLQKSSAVKCSAQAVKWQEWTSSPTDAESLSHR